MDRNQTMQRTPIINRLFFAVIAFLIITDPLAMIGLYKNGADTPPFVFWMIFAALPIIGLILITIKGDIRLRIHKIWTPIGLAAILFTVILLVFTYEGTSWNNLTESVYFVIGMGLLIAFIDLKILQDYAYYFFLYGLLTTIELFPAGFRAIQMTISDPGNIEWGAWIDEILFIAGPIFLYAFWKRLKSNPPGWKKAFLAIGGFILSIALLAILATGVSKTLPEGSWLSRWLANQKPMQSVTCTGSLCGNDIYVDPYSNLYISIEQAGLFREQGTYDFPLLAQDHALLGCSFIIDTGAQKVTITCKKNIQGTNSKTIDFNFSSSGDTKKEATMSSDIKTGAVWVEPEGLTKLQESVDSGEKREYLDPVEVSRIEGINYGFSVSDTFALQQKNYAPPEDTYLAVVSVSHQGKIYEITLLQPVTKGDQGIWAIAGISLTTN